MDTISLKEKISRGSNYTISLPSLSEEDGNTSYFTRFYARMRELCESFAASDPARIRNYKCTYTASSEDDTLTIEVILSARVKKHSSPSVTVTRRFVDKWSRGILISHIPVTRDTVQ